MVPSGVPSSGAAMLLLLKERGQLEEQGLMSLKEARSTTEGYTLRQTHFRLDILL